MKQQGSKVYDVLGELQEGQAQKTGFKLIALAGQIGALADGYFYEKKSSAEVKVVEMSIADKSQVDLLYELRQLVLDQLRQRGKKAQDEYSVISEAMDKKGMSPEELDKWIQGNIIKKLFS